MADFVSIRTSTLRGNQKIPFDLYVLINGKHILFIRSGDSFSGDRLKKLKSHKIKKMYILSEHEADYIQYVDTNLSSGYKNDPTQSMQDRSNIVQGHQEANAENVIENPGNADAYKLAKEGTSQYIDFLIHNKEGLGHILQIENPDQALSHHGVTVASLAVAIAQKLGITDSTNLELLSLGCLLHDMGHALSKENYAQPLASMGEEGRKKYLEHPRTGAEEVKETRHFDIQVINIIMQHEETADGSGFPQKISAIKIDRLALIAGTANAYDRLVTFEKVPPKEAAKKMLIEKMGKYPLDHLQALQSVLKEQGII